MLFVFLLIPGFLPGVFTLPRNYCSKNITSISSTKNITSISTSVPTSVPTSIPTSVPTKSNIPITFGNSATITYFTDTVFQCISGNPTGNAMAINPLLLGFTENDWTSLYVNADSKNIPWCGLTMTITINGKSFTGMIIDTCDPVGNTFVDPNTGQMIGGKCDYVNVIDLYGNSGLLFLKNVTNGNDFYQGTVSWYIN